MKSLIVASIVLLLFASNHSTDVYDDSLDLLVGTWQSTRKQPRMRISTTNDTTQDTCMCGSVYEFTYDRYYKEHLIEAACRDTVREGINPVLSSEDQRFSRWQTIEDSVYIKKTICMFKAETDSEAVIFPILSTSSTIDGIAEDLEANRLIDCVTTEIDRMRFTFLDTDTVFLNGLLMLMHAFDYKNQQCTHMTRTKERTNDQEERL
ncbi:MAG: hypothetical protein ACOCW2_01265 [Chitinivibrionales bacterium]